MFLNDEDLQWLKDLLDSPNELINTLGMCVIIHGRGTIPKSLALFKAGISEKLGCYDSLKLVTLEALATVLKYNPRVGQKFVELEDGRCLDRVFALVSDTDSHTRLMAYSCLVSMQDKPPFIAEKIEDQLEIGTLLKLLSDIKVEDSKPSSFNYLNCLPGEEILGHAFKLSYTLEGILRAVSYKGRRSKQDRLIILSSKELSVIID